MKKIILLLILSVLVSASDEMKTIEKEITPIKAIKVKSGRSNIDTIDILCIENQVFLLAQSSKTFIPYTDDKTSKILTCDKFNPTKY